MAKWQGGLRDFFTQAGSWLRRGSEAAGEWIDDTTAITQRLRTLRKLRGDQQQALRLIGAKVYTLHTLGKVRNKDVLVDCQHIDEILARIERLKKEIEEIKRHSTKPEVKLIKIEDDELLTEPGEEDAPVSPEAMTVEEPTETAPAEEAPAAELGTGEEPPPAEATALQFPSVQAPAEELAPAEPEAEEPAADVHASEPASEEPESHD
jgi:hypothetical protein